MDEVNAIPNSPTFKGRLTNTLNNTSGVGALVELPDSRLVVGSADGVIRIWDVSEKVHGRMNPVMDLLSYLGRAYARPTQTLIGHTGSVLALLVLPDGRLGSGSADGTIRLWNLNYMDNASTIAGRRNLVHGLYLRKMESPDRTSIILEGHTDAVHTLVLLPDGRLASGSADHTVRLWDLPSGTSQTLTQHENEVTALIMWRGQLVSGSLDGTIVEWDTNTGVGHRIYVYEYPILSMVTVPRLGLAVGSRLGFIHLISQYNGRTLNVRLGIIDITSLVVMLNGKLVVGGYYGGMATWDPVTGSIEFFSGQQGGVGAVAVLCGGGITSGSRDGAIYVWD